MTTDESASAPGGLDDLIKSRIESLRPKLLDLSRRNPLLATRLSPRSNSLIRVVDELPDVLASYLCGQERMLLQPLPGIDEHPRDEDSKEFRDALAKGKRNDPIYVQAIQDIDQNSDESADVERHLERELRDRIRTQLGMAPRLTKGSDVTLAQHARNNGIDPSYDLPDPDNEHEDGRHQDKRIQALLLPEDLERRLNALNSKCRTWIQETGINVLHMAFGFLEWIEPNAAESSFAPLVLLPIQIEKTKTRDGAEYWAKANGNDTETNLVLAEKLRLQFAIDLPKFEGGSIEHYLQEVAAASPKSLIQSYSLWRNRILAQRDYSYFSDPVSRYGNTW